MLLRIHVVPPRRDRFKVRVGAAAEELARRLARGLSSAPRLAGGEGRASRAARSDYCEQQRHWFACTRMRAPAVCSVQRAVVQQLYGCDFDSQLDSCAVQMCSMGVPASKATAMLSNDSPAAGLASALQAASSFAAVFLLPGLATTRQRSHCTAAAMDGGGRSHSFMARPAPK